MRRALLGIGAAIIILTITLSAVVWLAILGAQHVGRTSPLGVSAGLVIAVVVAIGAIAFAARRLTRPVGAWLFAVEQLEAGDYSVRLPQKGPPQIRRLAQSFNAVATRLGTEDEQRRRLLADITHELRTPLTVIKGEIEGMLDGVYAPDAARLAGMLNEVNVLSRLIEDLKTLSQAESGALRLFREPTDIGVLCAETVATFSTQAESGGVSLVAFADEDLPIIDVDPVRLKEVLANLITNAIRHTPRGGRITVSASIHESIVRIVVQDTGEGIPADDLEHVFDRFSRSATSSGMGLGLAIVKGLVEAHGGSVAASSKTGNGATLEVSLPVDA